MEDFVLDKPGIMLAPTQEKVEKWALQLKGTKHPVAIVSVQPIASAAHTEKATIELKERTAEGQERSKVVTAFINSFSQQIIKYGGSVGEVTRKSTPTTTVVLRARTQASVISNDSWATCKKWAGPMDIKKFLKDRRADLHVEDIFRVEIEQKEVTFLVRVYSRQEKEWLKATDLPLSFSPTGEAIRKFKVVWDRETSTLEALHKKFSHLKGFSGPVLSARGIGARFEEDSYQEARQKAGLAVGRIFSISGLPPENSEQDIVELMKDCNWEVQPIPGSKRVKGMMAMIRVRAQTEPQSSSRSTCSSSGPADRSLFWSPPGHGLKQ